MTVWGRIRAFAAACSLVAAAALQPFVASAQSDAGDYPIADGQFFTEAVPNRNDGAGFAVEDGQGAKLWTAFKAQGGVDTLGYPISRRFDFRGDVAQAFQNGFLVWNADHGSAERLDFSQLPGRKPPATAVQADFPPTASAEVEPAPWSGWWWPASPSVGPTLYAPGSPLQKYDQYVTAVTGDNPDTFGWERQEVYFPGTTWAGHCNGFAAAALLEPEPTASVDVLGITFSVADLKGLLVDYHFGDAAAWSFGGADGGDLNPADFQRMLLNWVGSAGKGFVLTYDMGGGEVWSYPVYRFES
ncbi:MAG: hypothetical protein JOY61_08670, partial [Chloroflexi bacterium]|nr:hypothetical protein [Chloroflexota bacterium]